MNILFVTGVYPPRIGGPSIQTHRLARLCRARGWKVRVLTFGKAAERRTEGGIEIATVRDQGRGVGTKYASTAVILDRLIREQRPDLLVHQTGVDYMTFVTGLVGRRHNVPVFVKHAGDLAWERLTRFTIDAATGDKPLHESGVTARALIAVERLALSLCRRVWSLSMEQTRFLETVLKLPPGKIFTHRNMAVIPREASRKSRDGKHLRLLSVSRLIQRKNLDALIRAVPLIKDSGVSLEIVGGGYKEIEIKLRELIRELKLSQRVRLAGETSPLKMAEHYRSADVFVLPSIYEHFPLAAAEAMAHGLPVVAARVWGIEEAVQEGRTGLLVDHPTPDALAGCIDELAGRPTLVSRMAHAAVKRARWFDINRFGSEILDEYERTVAAPS